MMPIVNQIEYFLWTTVIGIVLAFCFDFYRVIRWKTKPSRWITNILDLLIWIAATAFAYTVLLSVNWGEVRLYVLLGMALGAFIYYRWFSRGVVKKWHFIFGLFGRIWRVGSRIMRIPFRLVKRLLGYPLGLITLILFHIGKFLRGIKRLSKIVLVNQLLRMSRHLKSVLGRKPKT